MPAVVMDLTQSGSGSSEIHLEAGDSLAFELNDASGSPPQGIYSSALDYAINHSTSLTALLGVTFTFNNSGGSSTPITITQSGSATTSIAAQAGDTVTLALPTSTFGVWDPVLAQWIKHLEALFVVTGVKFVLNPSGGAT